MIEKIFRVTCDWCGMEAHYFMETRKENVEKHYSENHLMYKHIKINTFADELWTNSKHFIHNSLEFCCEACAEEYFKENPEDRAHYKLVKIK